MRILLLCCLLFQCIAAERALDVEKKDGISGDAAAGYLELQTRAPDAAFVYYKPSRIRSVTVDENGLTRIRIHRLADEQAFSFRIRKSIQDSSSIFTEINKASGNAGFRCPESNKKYEKNGSYRIMPSPIKGFVNIRKDSFSEKDIHVSVAYIDRIQIDRHGQTHLFLKKEIGRSLVTYSIRKSTQHSSDVMSIIRKAKQ